MAIVSTLKVGGTSLHPSRAGNVKVPYLVENIIDFAEAATAKGSALAAADVIEALAIPAGTVVVGAGAVIVAAGNSTTLTLTVGTGTDADEWVATLDGKAVAGTFGADLNSDTTFKTFPTADTIDVTLATLTGTLTAGKVRVYALLMDVSGKKAPGLAVLGS